MEVKDIEVPYIRSNPVFELYLIGDIHAGTIHCAEDNIRKKIAKIASKPNSLVIGMGDMAEYITIGDRRFDPNQRSVAPWVEQDNVSESLIRWLVELLSPIQDKIIGLLYGNHEDDYRRKSCDNVHKNLCSRLEVENLGYSAFVRLFFKREKSLETHTIRGVFTHGSGCAITKGAKLNRLRRFMDDFAGDIYGYGHTHDVITDTRPYMDLNSRIFGEGHIKAKERLGAMTGSWFRTYTKGIVASYGERKVYPPTVIGCAKFTINAHTGEMDVSRSL